MPKCNQLTSQLLFKGLNNRTQQSSAILW